MSCICSNTVHFQHKSSAIQSENTFVDDCCKVAIKVYLKRKNTFYSVTYASSNQWNTGRKTKMLLQEIKDFGRSRFEKSKDLFGYSK